MSDPERPWSHGRALVESLKSLAEFYLPVRLGGKGRGTCALDYGCGIGRTSAPLEQWFDRVIGLDVSSELVRQARSCARARGSAVEFELQAGYELMNVPDGSVEFLLSYATLRYIDPRHLRTLFQAYDRVLGPSGVLLVNLTVRPDDGFPEKAIVGPIYHARRLMSYLRTYVRLPLTPGLVGAYVPRAVTHSRLEHLVNETSLRAITLTDPFRCSLRQPKHKRHRAEHKNTYLLAWKDPGLALRHWHPYDPASARQGIWGEHA